MFVSLGLLLDILSIVSLTTGMWRTISSLTCCLVTCQRNNIIVKRTPLKQQKQQHLLQCLTTKLNCETQTIWACSVKLSKE